MDKRLLAIALCGAAISTFHGCAWPARSSFGRSKDANASTSGSFAGGSSTATPSLSIETPDRNGSEGISNTFTAAYRKAKDVVSDAFVIEPKVIPPDDPTRINTKMVKVNGEVYRQAAQLMESQGNFAGAAEQYQRALESDKGDIASYVALARLRSRQEKYMEAEKLYHQALKIDPDNGVVWNDLGLCLARQQKTPEALEAVRRAVQLEPRKSLYRNNLAAVLVQDGNPAEAFRQLVTIHEPATAHYNVAYLLYDRGDHAGAREYLGQALKHNPSLEPAHQLAAVIEGARADASDRFDPRRAMPSSQPDVYLGPAAMLDPGSNPYANSQVWGLSQPRLASQPENNSNWSDPPRAAPLPAHESEPPRMLPRVH